jgi:hypothetical protein
MHAVLFTLPRLLAAGLETSGADKVLQKAQAPCCRYSPLTREPRSHKNAPAEKGSVVQGIRVCDGPGEVKTSGRLMTTRVCAIQP